MKLNLRDISLRDLAVAVGAKVDQFEMRPNGREGMVGTCRYDGTRMRTSEARKLIEARYLAAERRHS